MNLCSTIDGRPLRGRSALSNDALKLRGIDGRSRGGRRYRDLMRAYAGELGGIESVSEPQRALCAQAATLTIQIETLQSRVIAGDAIDPELIVRTGNVQLRALAALGLRKGQRVENGSDALNNYLASIAARQEAEDAEVDAP
jgi:hypothetical protein